MTSEPRRRRSPGEVRAILDQLQLIADNPQLRKRLGYGRVSLTAPYADSRRPTDAGDRTRRFMADYRGRSSDRDRNYAAGLL